MTKIKNIILFSMFTNSLKYKIRTGWKDVRVSGRKESVAEHVYGTLMLAQVIMD